jgi:DNA-binding MarR family transcriptional regulator
VAAEQREATLKILGSLHAVNRALRRRARAQHGDSFARLTVLSAVATAGGARASDLADQLLIDLSSVSRRLSTLEAEGLVEKVVDESDRRAHLVALTRRGHDLLNSLRQSAGDGMSGVLAGWSRRDLDLLGRLLVRLEADLSAAEGMPTTTSSALPGK